MRKLYAFMLVLLLCFIAMFALAGVAQATDPATPTVTLDKTLVPTFGGIYILTGTYTGAKPLGFYVGGKRLVTKFCRDGRFAAAGYILFWSKVYQQSRVVELGALFPAGVWVTSPFTLYRGAPPTP